MTLTDFDPDGEIEGRRRGALRRVRAARRSAARDRATDVRRRPRRAAARLRRRRAPTAATSRAARSSARSYRFDVLADYGAFRDLQRHRLLTLEWQPLSTRHGYVEPAAIEEAGALDDWRAVMDQSAELYDALRRARAARRRALRRRHGLPRPLLHGHERPRGDARHRAAHRAAGASRRTAASAS